MEPSSPSGSRIFKDNELLINYHDAVIYGWELKLIERRTEWLNDSCIHFYFTHLQQEHLAKKNATARSFLFMDPSVVSFWMHQCVDQDEIYDFCTSTRFPGRVDQSDGTIFIAVNDKMSRTSSSPFSFHDDWQVSGGGNHWSLLVIQVKGGTSTKKRKTTGESSKPQSIEFWHFDSVHNSGNLRAAQDIASKLSEHVYPGASILTQSTEGMVQQAKTPQQENGYDCGVHVLAAAKILSKSLFTNPSSDILDLEQSLRQEMGANPQDFCSNLRREISSEIRRLYDEAQENEK